MRVAVLDCCQPNPPRLAAWPSVGGVIVDWLSPQMPGVAIDRIDVWGGDALPSVDAYDAWVVSGSEMGVYDSPAWMAPTRAFLGEIRTAGKPVLGICFGHQLMADTFGGMAEKAGTGYVAGTRRVGWGEQQFDAYFLHQDQVRTVPPGAEVLASAAHCPIAALAYDFPALSVQFHPEYERGYVEAVIDLVEGGKLDAERAAFARQSLDEGAVAGQLFARQAADFLRSGVSGRDFARSIGVIA